MPTALRTAAALAGVVALGACGPDRETDEEAVASPTVVTYTASDFAFTGPTEIPAGAVTFRLSNDGQEMHHAVLARLDSGRTLGDVIQFYSDEADPLLRNHPAFLTYLGGPGTGVPGSAMEATSVLDPGEYVLICYVASPDGTIHFQKGMAKTIRVTPSETMASEPAASVRLILRDFAFELSQPLTAGRHTVRVTNEGPQIHDVELVRLQDGASVGQFLQTLEPGAATPPPGELVAGVGGISPGQSVFWTVTLEPGVYALLCFVPDHEDGAPHFAHGMVQQFDVT